MEENQENILTEICPDCNGTAYGKHMEHYEKWVDKQTLLDFGMHYCKRCGTKGKLDFIDHAMGKRFISENPGEARELDKQISDFVALTYWTEFDPYICDEGDSKNSYEKVSEHIKRIINGIDEDLFIYPIDINRFDNNEYLLVENSADSLLRDLQVSLSVCKYINKSIVVTGFNIIFISVFNLMNAGGLLTKDSLKEIEKNIKYIGFDDSCSSNSVSEFFNNYQGSIYYLTDDEKSYILDMSNSMFESYEDFIDAIKYSEANNVKPCLSKEKANELGIIRFDEK